VAYEAHKRVAVVATLLWRTPRESINPEEIVNERNSIRDQTPELKCAMHREILKRYYSNPDRV